MTVGVAGTAGQRCNKCGTAENLCVHPYKSGGFRSMCRDCDARDHRERRARKRAEKLGLPPPQFAAPDLPSEVAPIGELRERRRGESRRRISAFDARRLIEVQIHTAGPIGLLVAGDLHLDDPGTNWDLVERHVQLVLETEGLFAGQVGDIQNAWIGRLARLYGNQGTTAREAWALCEWWINTLAAKLIFISAGNHDAWAQNVNSLDPIDWITSQHETVYGRQNGARIGLRLPDGELIVINCRHDFSGRSQFNPAHGVTRAAMFGHRDDILLAGHTHAFGYNPIKDPATGRVSHPIRLASYKQIDDYAMEKGFPDSNVTEAVVIIYDPLVSDQRHRIHVDFNPERGARMLTMLRREWAASQKAKPAKPKRAA